MPLDQQRLIRAVGTMLAESEEATAKAIAEVREEVAAKIAALPAPEAALPGRDGEDGKDGIDRVLAAPAVIDPDQRCERNEIIHHNKGIWQAIRATTGDPDKDPAGWKCLVPGVATIAHKVSLSSRTVTATFTTSDGHAHHVSWEMPPGYLPPDWQQKRMGIVPGDILREGDHDYIALRYNPGNPLDAKTAENWQKMQVVGRRGKQGNPGIGLVGEAGPGLVGMTLVRDPAGGSLAILPEYADKRVKPEPIAVDLMVEPPAPGRSAIVGFAGRFHTSKKYGRGDVVSAIIDQAPGLWLSLKPENKALLSDASAWERMI